MPDGPYRKNAGSGEPEDPTLAALAQRGEGAKATRETAAHARKRATLLVRGYLDVGHWPAPHASLGAWLRGWAASLLADASLMDVMTINVGSDAKILALCEALPNTPFAKGAGERRRLEAQWAVSLPFALGGYVDVLAEEADEVCKLDLAIAWTHEPPARDPLQAALYVHDAQAQIVSHDAQMTVIRSGEVSGETGWKINFQDHMFLQTNGRIVTYLHGLLDSVLLPIQAAHPIARVLVKRITVMNGL